MRVGVIRNDLSAPILAADLEQVSRRNSSVDAPGQVAYLSYPTVATVEAALADSTTGVGATITGSDISGSLPLTVNGTNDVLELKTASGDAFTAYSIANAAYASVDALVDALNTAFGTDPVRAFNGGNDNIVLESTLYGVDSYLESDTIAGGSTGNTDLGFADGVARDMPAASAFITAAGLPGGPMDLSQATMEVVGAGSNSNALEPYYDAGQYIGVLDAFAQLFAETDVAVESCLVGMMSGFASAAFNPDSRNNSVTAGAAVTILDDDGSAFSQTVPTATSATLDTPAAGDVTIAGTGLGKESGDSTEPLRSTTVKFTGAVSKTLPQESIEAAGGSVSDTAVVVPASLIPGATTTTTSVQVKFRQLVSDVEAVA